MAHSFSLGKVDLVAATDPEEVPHVLDSGRPFRIAVLGDFSGRANRGRIESGPDLARRRPIRIDRDNFDDVLDSLGVELRLPVPGEGDDRLVLRFRELEDFHPDRIYERADVFQALREVRRQLNNPATFAAAARKMGIGPGSSAGARPAEPVREAAGTDSTGPAPSDANLLERILDESRGQTGSTGSRESGPWAEFIERIAAPYRVAAADPRQAELVAGVDTATGDLLRGLLHHPDFQAVEAAWRALFFLVRRLETDAQLTVSLIDVTRAELEADLNRSQDLKSTGMYRLLVESTVGTPGGEPWAVLVGAGTFGPTLADVELLGRLGELARRAGAPFLAAASPRILGCDSLAATPDPEDWGREAADPVEREVWNTLRRQPAAAYLGLALPRFLLRLPYGRNDSPIEAFQFEELTTNTGHESYLWGSSAFLLAELLGRSFSRSGWALRPGEFQEVDGLPLHIARGDDETRVVPCAEVVLSYRTAEVLVENGLMPVLSFRDQDVVRVGRFQSLAEPLAPLAGPWSA